MESSATASYYDSLADHYDDVTQAPGVWNAPGHVERALALLPVISSGLIVGVGTGQDIPPLIRRGATVLEGIDISSRMIEKCKAKYPAVPLICGDFNQQTGFSRRTFDVVVCSGTSEFIEDIGSFFVRASELVASEGHLVFTFEPMIENHPIQRERASSPTETASGQLPPSNFITYRRHLIEIVSIAFENSLFMAHQWEYVSYRKADRDIVYHLVIFSHKNRIT